MIQEKVPYGFGCPSLVSAYAAFRALISRSKVGLG